MPPRVLDPEQVARWERDLDARSLRWWVAEGGGPSVVGFVGTGSSRDPLDRDLGELDTIAVSPPWWRHGVGSRLMSLLFEIWLARVTPTPSSGPWRSTSKGGTSTRRPDGAPPVRHAIVGDRLPFVAHSWTRADCRDRVWIGTAPLVAPTGGERAHLSGPELSGGFTSSRIAQLLPVRSRSPFARRRHLDW
ncbi:GNAT family N-acetyltransferase [Nocardioides sp.]|uniref:GNAT family N-acetyltransferase n=1 Tax=Nocardioides sp. TaxID=35761 RepID=UPI0039C91145